MTANTREHRRLAEDKNRTANWKRWGPYLSERQWATVREDYSAESDVWRSFPHDHARSRAYRWGEDGILGIADRQCRVCFALALWNHRDPILKERLFGLSGPEGNHGEDVKELYYYLDSTPTHSYMKGLYKYPQAEFPYARLVDENRRRGLQDPEFDLADTGIFDDGRYFDVFVEYAKAAAHYSMIVPAGGSVTIDLRLCGDGMAGDWGKPRQTAPKPFSSQPTPVISELFRNRIAEADEFYATIVQADPAHAQIQRQAHAGLLWTKQFYHYVVQDWLKGDGTFPAPPDARWNGRNRNWKHLFARDILSMPDKWEYPWFAAWDTAFHMLPFAETDPDFAKDQMLLFLREWYLHPNGQIPAYEWKFSDVNPPVHAWACWRIYKITAPAGERDREFLERCFQKLLLNFTWWVNRKDSEGRNLFAGGFLGLDNIGIFDRSTALPGDQRLEQADGTAWMAFYALTMLNMALELARRPGGGVITAYEDMASKFFEHFVQIVDAINHLGGHGLWDEDDGFYYDQILDDGNPSIPLRTRSLVGLLPLVAVELLDEQRIADLPGFKKRMDWFLNHRSDLAVHVSYCQSGGTHGHRLLAVPSRGRLQRLLAYLLDEREFLSPFGIRSLSRHHEAHPFTLHLQGEDKVVRYVPGESDSHMFGGGNSNWRGPVWFPIAYLIIEALERYHHFYGSGFTVELPTGSGNHVTLKEAADEIARRMSRLFEPDADGHRPCHGGDHRYATDPAWKDLILFHEFFHADTGRGCGASHQTGWTALVARLIRKR